MIAEHLLDRRRLRGIVERRGRAVGVDVADVGRRDIAVGERELDGAGGLPAVRPRRGHVIGVVGVRVTDDFGIDPGAPRDRAAALLEDEDGGALTHDEAVPARVEGA